MTGNGAEPSTPSHDNANALIDRSLHNNTAYENSPLQIFVKAKKKINDIFGEIEEYVTETARFMDGKFHASRQPILRQILMLCFDFMFSLDQSSSTSIVDKAESDQFHSYVLKVAAIRQVLNRDHMKVAFFGRTSNGKSSVINAMLRDRILPSGIGHTTNCFCQVEGSDGKEAYLIKEDSDEKLNVTVCTLKNQISYTPAIHHSFFVVFSFFAFIEYQTIGKCIV